MPPPPPDPSPPGGAPWRVRAAGFLCSAPDVSTCPPAGPPELALAGRSNAGKSSLLNALAGRRGLARTGQTPGRTRLLNLFDLELARGAERRPLRLVDLPGYGFASGSKAERAALAPMVRGYVAGREGLRALVLLVDVRRGLGALDWEMLELASGADVPSLVVLTKADKLGASRRGMARREVAGHLGVHPQDLLLTSARTGLGVADDGRGGGLVGALADLVAPEADGPPSMADPAKTSREPEASP